LPLLRRWAAIRSPLKKISTVPIITALAEQGTKNRAREGLPNR
jgi:hypothetical protein